MRSKKVVAPPADCGHPELLPAAHNRRRTRSKEAAQPRTASVALDDIFIGHGDGGVAGREALRETQDREWTVHDGLHFSRSSLQAVGRCPEGKLLVKHVTQLLKSRRRYDTPERSRAPRSAAPAAQGGLSPHAAVALRSLWLVDGTAPMCHLDGTAPTCHDLAGARPPIGTMSGAGSLDPTIAAPQGTMPGRASSRAGKKAAHGAAEKIEMIIGEGLPASIVHALRLQRLHCVRAWLELGGSVHATDGTGSTMLHFAVLCPFDAAVDLLLSHGTPVDARLPTGATPLLLACFKAHPTTVSKLLAASADPDLPDAHGHTPLMACSRSGHMDLVRALLSAGASPNVRDDDGRTALWYAVKYEQRAVAVALRQHRAASSGASGARKKRGQGR